MNENNESQHRGENAKEDEQDVLDDDAHGQQVETQLQVENGRQHERQRTAPQRT